MTYTHFDYAIDEHVARITINRPKSYNSLNLEAMREFWDIANRCSSDRSVRAVLLTGSGEKAFCAGGDVASFAEDPETVDRLLKEMQ